MQEQIRIGSQSAERTICCSVCVLKIVTLWNNLVLSRKTELFQAISKNKPYGSLFLLFLQFEFGLLGPQACGYKLLGTDAIVRSAPHMPTCCQLSFFILDSCLVQFQIHKILFISKDILPLFSQSLSPHVSLSLPSAIPCF